MSKDQTTPTVGFYAHGVNQMDLRTYLRAAPMKKSKGGTVDTNTDLLHFEPAGEADVSMPTEYFVAPIMEWLAGRDLGEKPTETCMAGFHITAKADGISVSACWVETFGSYE